MRGDRRRPGRDTCRGANQSQLARAMVRHLETYNGISSDLELNAAGDRILDSYDIIRVVGGQSGFRWMKIAQIRKGPSDL
jgi:ABC-type branched-subunit amino acid transport system substrate-binding protein